MRRRVWIVLGCMMLAGCGGRDLSDLEAYVAEVKARPKGAIEPMPEIKPSETFVFDPEGLRDPFVPEKPTPPPQVAVTSSGVKPDPTRPREALEEYALDGLRMMGTIKKDEILWGLVQTPEGTVHRVKAGNYMGQNHGRIVQVLEDRIELVEIVPDAPGTWRERQASLAMAQ
ncbi:MAG: pilus assembly protein PilP [Methylohalobius sp.]|nr:pilus assembly protein PilP [Methylohalobius sp.]